MDVNTTKIESEYPEKDAGRSLKKQYSTFSGIVFIVGLVFLPTLIYAVAELFMPLRHAIAGTLTAVAFVVAVVYFFLKRAKYDFLDLENMSRNSLVGLIYGIPFLLLFVSVVFDPESILSIYASNLIKRHGSSEYYPRFLYSTFILSATFLEEVFFRGIIQENISKTTNTSTAVGLTTLLFVVVHFPHSGISSEGLILWSVLGLLTGFAYAKTKSLVSPFIVHLICNARVIFLAPLIL